MIAASIRFYAELNTLLKPENRFRTFNIKVASTETLKDTIESLGVPHPLVQLVLVNSHPVYMTNRINLGDHISVFPFFRNMDLTSIVETQSDFPGIPQFAADSHLGKLTSYLRMAGFDTRYQNHWDQYELINYAIKEQRILLTRSCGLLKRKTVQYGYYLFSQDPLIQLQEVFDRYQLNKYQKPFTRCIKCNGQILQVKKNQIEQRLEPKTKQFFNEFWICQQCDQIYWRGSHFSKMANLIDRLN